MAKSDRLVLVGLCVLLVCGVCAGVDVGAVSKSAPGPSGCEYHGEFRQLAEGIRQGSSYETVVPLAESFLRFIECRNSLIHRRQISMRKLLDGVSESLIVGEDDNSFRAAAKFGMARLRDALLAYSKLRNQAANYAKRNLNSLAMKDEAYFQWSLRSDVDPIETSAFEETYQYLKNIEHLQEQFARIQSQFVQMRTIFMDAMLTLDWRLGDDVTELWPKYASEKMPRDLLRGVEEAIDSVPDSADANDASVKRVREAFLELAGSLAESFQDFMNSGSVSASKGWLISRGVMKSLSLNLFSQDDVGFGGAAHEMFGLYQMIVLTKNARLKKCLVSEVGSALSTATGIELAENLMKGEIPKVDKYKRSVSRLLVSLTDDSGEVVLRQLQLCRNTIDAETPFPSWPRHILHRERRSPIVRDVDTASNVYYEIAALAAEGYFKRSIIREVSPFITSGQFDVLNRKNGLRASAGGPLDARAVLGDRVEFAVFPECVSRLIGFLRFGRSYSHHPLVLADLNVSERGSDFVGQRLGDVLDGVIDPAYNAKVTRADVAAWYRYRTESFGDISRGNGHRSVVKYVLHPNRFPFGGWTTMYQFLLYSYISSLTYGQYSELMLTLHTARCDMENLHRMVQRMEDGASLGKEFVAMVGHLEITSDVTRAMVQWTSEVLAPYCHERYMMIRPMALSNYAAEKKLVSAAHFIPWMTNRFQRELPEEWRDQFDLRKLVDTVLSILNESLGTHAEGDIFQITNDELQDFLSMFEVKSSKEVQRVQNAWRHLDPGALAVALARRIEEILGVTDPEKQGGTTDIAKSISFFKNGVSWLSGELKGAFTEAASKMPLKRQALWYSKKRKEAWTLSKFIKCFRKRLPDYKECQTSVNVNQKKLIGYHAKFEYEDLIAKIDDVVSGTTTGLALWYYSGPGELGTKMLSVLLEKVPSLGPLMETAAGREFQSIMKTRVGDMIQELLSRLRSEATLSKMSGLVRQTPYVMNREDAKNKLEWGGSVEYLMGSERQLNHIFAEMLHQLSINLLRSEGARRSVRVTDSSDPCYDVPCFLEQLDAIGVTVSAHVEQTSTAWVIAETTDSENLPPRWRNSNIPFSNFFQVTLPYTENPHASLKNLLKARPNLGVPLSHGQMTFIFDYEGEELARVDYYHGSNGLSFYPGIQHTAPWYCGDINVSYDANNEMAAERAAVASVMIAVLYDFYTSPDHQQYTLMDGYGVMSVCLDGLAVVQNVQALADAPRGLEGLTPHGLGMSTVFPSLITRNLYIDQLRKLSREYFSTWSDPMQEAFRMTLASLRTLPSDTALPDQEPSSGHSVEILATRTSLIRRMLRSTPMVSFRIYPQASSSGTLLCDEFLRIASYFKTEEEGNLDAVFDDFRDHLLAEIQSHPDWDALDEKIQALKEYEVNERVAAIRRKLMYDTNDSVLLRICLDVPNAAIQHGLPSANLIKTVIDDDERTQKQRSRAMRYQGVGALKPVLRRAYRRGDSVPALRRRNVIADVVTSRDWEQYAEIERVVNYNDEAQVEDTVSAKDVLMDLIKLPIMRLVAATNDDRFMAAALKDNTDRICLEFGLVGTVAQYNFCRFVLRRATAALRTTSALDTVGVLAPASKQILTRNEKDDIKSNYSLRSIESLLKVMWLQGKVTVGARNFDDYKAQWKQLDHLAIVENELNDIMWELLCNKWVTAANLGEAAVMRTVES